MSRSDGRAAEKPFSWTAAGSRPKDKKHQIHKEPVHSLQKLTQSNSHRQAHRSFADHGGR